MTFLVGEKVNDLSQRKDGDENFGATYLALSKLKTFVLKLMLTPNTRYYPQKALSVG